MFVSLGIEFGGEIFAANVKLTGVLQRAENAVVWPVERRVGLFGSCVVPAGRWLG